MKDIVITINPTDSTVQLNTLILGVKGENLQRKLIVEFTENFIDGTATLQYKRKSGEKGFVGLQKEEEAYTGDVTTELTAETTIKAQVKIVQGTTEKGTPIFKSKVFEMTVCDCIDTDL